MQNEVPSLSSLGRRIIVMGPTNAGKSTLAVALARHLSVPAHHIDQFRHLPASNWQQRPTIEFHELHDSAIREPEWIMDGNYSEVLPQRLARATGIIVVDDTLRRRYWRYFRRTLGPAERVGALEGQKDRVSWQMIHWLWHTRHAAERSRKTAQASGLPHVFCRTQHELNALYAAWNLTR